MTRTFDIQIGKSLQEAWNIFLRAPEVFTLLTLGYLFLYYVFAQLQGAGLVMTILVNPFAFAAVFVLADDDRASGKANFSALKALSPLLPQLVMIGLIKTILILAGLAFFILPGIYLAVSYTFVYLFVTQNGKTFWDALEASRKLVHEDWFAVFGLWLFVWILFFSGLLLAGIGILVTAPLAILTIYCAYRNLKRVEVIG
jgi:uncharacterized membrane protein